ncbi:MFS transporter [bacterium]|jgi:sugar phosphate permease|nr:MFS transporter [bacterium]
MLWVLWITYGSFYFCRTNISAAIPGLGQEFDLSKSEIGLILGALKIAYALGQLINGQLAERISARRLLAIGMFVSAALNIVFGFGTALYFFVFIWACNGYAQALGWPPSMRVAANWFPSSKRGKAIGIIGTGYQVSAAATFIIAGFSADHFGWRGAMFLPAGLFFLGAVHMLFFLHEHPREEDPESPAVEKSVTVSAEVDASPARSTFMANLTVTLSNPALWLLGLSLGLLNACRYGFLDWGISHLLETSGGSIGKAGVKYALLPVGGIAGSLLVGWMTDRYFGGRRAPVICVMLVLLGCLTLVYNEFVSAGLWYSMPILFLVGFTVYGSQVHLVGSAPMDLARKGTAAAGVGFVNCLGYVGAFSGDAVTGILVDRFEWRVALYFWAACAFVSAGTTGLLWKTTAKTD